MRTLLVLIVAACLGALGYMILRGKSENRPQLERAEQRISHDATELKDNLKDKLKLDFKTEDIKEELARTGKVIRQKASQVGDAVADATADARVTAAIKSKFAVDSDLSAWKISVNTTAGLVTLSGTVASHELIGKAIQTALTVDGAREVVSTLQVKP